MTEKLLYLINTLTRQSSKGKGGCAILKRIIKSGIHKWTFEILKENGNHYWMSIGILKAKNIINDYLVWTRVDNFTDEIGYG